MIDPSAQLAAYQQRHRVNQRNAEKLRKQVNRLEIDMRTSLAREIAASARMNPRSSPNDMLEREVTRHGRARITVAGSGTSLYRSMASNLNRSGTQAGIRDTQLRHSNHLTTVQSMVSAQEKREQGYADWARAKKPKLIRLDNTKAMTRLIDNTLAQMPEGATAAQQQTCVNNLLSYVALRDAEKLGTNSQARQEQLAKIQQHYRSKLKDVRSTNAMQGDRVAMAAVAATSSQAMDAVNTHVSAYQRAIIRLNQSKTIKPRSLQNCSRDASSNARRIARQGIGRALAQGCSADTIIAALNDSPTLTAHAKQYLNVVSMNLSGMELSPINPSDTKVIKRIKTTARDKLASSLNKRPDDLTSSDINDYRNACRAQQLGQALQNEEDAAPQLPPHSAYLLVLAQEFQTQAEMLNAASNNRTLTDEAKQELVRQYHARAVDADDSQLLVSEDNAFVQSYFGHTESKLSDDEITQAHDQLDDLDTLYNEVTDTLTDVARANTGGEYIAADMGNDLVDAARLQDEVQQTTAALTDETNPKDTSTIHPTPERLLQATQVPETHFAERLQERRGERGFSKTENDQTGIVQDATKLQRLDMATKSFNQASKRATELLIQCNQLREQGLDQANIREQLTDLQKELTAAKGDLDKADKGLREALKDSADVLGKDHFLALLNENEEQAESLLALTKALGDNDSVDKMSEAVATACPKIDTDRPVEISYTSSKYFKESLKKGNSQMILPTLIAWLASAVLAKALGKGPMVRKVRDENGQAIKITAGMRHRALLAFAEKHPHLVTTEMKRGGARISPTERGRQAFQKFMISKAKEEQRLELPDPMQGAAGKGASGSEASTDHVDGQGDRLTAHRGGDTNALRGQIDTSQQSSGAGSGQGGGTTTDADNTALTGRIDRAPQTSPAQRTARNAALTGSSANPAAHPAATGPGNSSS